MARLQHKKIKTPVKGYKVFKLKGKSLDCRGHKFGTVNSVLKKSHKVEGVPQLCNNGFHFCEKLEDCFRYYSSVPFSMEGFVVCEVEAHDMITTGTDNKRATTHLKVTKILTLQEVKDKMGFKVEKPRVIKAEKHDLIIESRKSAWNGRTSLGVTVPGHGRVKVPRSYHFVENVGCEVTVEYTVVSVPSKPRWFYANMSVSRYNEYKIKFL